MSLNRFRLFQRSSDTRAEDRRQQEVLVLCHGGDRAGLGVLQNALASLGSARILYTVVDLSISMTLPPIERYSALVICTDRVNEIGPDKARLLTEWVSGGGGVIVAIRCWHADLAPLFGLSSIGTPQLAFTQGLDFTADVVPAAKGLRIEPTDWIFNHSRLVLTDAGLDPACHILARDLAGDPVAWRQEFKAGRVVYWNTNVLQARVLRGVLLQAILDAMGTAAAAIGGFATISIDDFPPPLSSNIATPIAHEFPGLDESGFYFGPWLSDMLDLRRRCQLRYSWYTVIDYADEGAAQPDAEGIRDGVRILKERFDRTGPLPSEDEIGFHGYNHQQATADCSTDLDLFREQLVLARKLWQEYVPAPLPTSWVPAGNRYHAEHARILAQVFPEITTVSSLHAFGDSKEGEYREFGPDPWCDQLFCMPRNNFGYRLQPKQRLLLLSQIAGSGNWTHFLHPDDVLDEPRPGADPVYIRNQFNQMWKETNAAGRPGLFREFEAFTGFVRSAFPWLRFLTNSEAAELQRRNNTAQINLALGPETIEIESSVGGLFYLRSPSDQEIESMKGDSLVVWQRDVVGGRLHVVDCPPGRSIFRLFPTSRQT